MFEIPVYVDDDFGPVVSLWDRCDLIRPWNDPRADIAQCMVSTTSTVFGGEISATDAPPRVIASIMTGSDGHRGWLYYLAVDLEQQGGGLGRRMVEHAEQWLEGLGVTKVQLMIREENESVRRFYERVGYAVEPRMVMSRWLRTDG